MASLLANAAAPSHKPFRRLQQLNRWQYLAYRLARRGAGLQLAQVWACDLNTIAERRRDNKYEFRQLDADDLCRLAADPENDLAPDEVSRLAGGGHRCFGAFDGPNLACYVWFATGNIGPEDSMGIPLAIPADTCYLFKAFAVPAYRGRGIYLLTAQRAFVEHCKLGKAQGIALIEYGNMASIRSHDRIGMKPHGWIIKLGWGGLAYRWYTSAGATAALE